MIVISFLNRDPQICNHGAHLGGSTRKKKKRKKKKKEKSRWKCPAEGRTVLACSPQVQEKSESQPDRVVSVN